MQERVIINIKPEIQGIFEKHHDDIVEAMVLVSKNGIPLTAMTRRSGKNESFSALTATIYGASDVVFTSFDKTSPTIIEVNSQNDVLMIKGVGKSMVLALMGSVSDKNSLERIMNAVSEEIENSSSFKK